MTATFIADLAIVILPLLCLALLIAIGVQLDFGEPEYAGPALYRNVMSRHEQQERDLHAEIQAQRQARRARHLAEPDWKFDTQEWNRKLLGFLTEPDEEEPVRRSVFGTPETADEWAVA